MSRELDDAIIEQILDELALHEIPLNEMSISTAVKAARKHKDCPEGTSDYLYDLNELRIQQSIKRFIKRGILTLKKNKLSFTEPLDIVRKKKYNKTN
jgi:hypothetical protein